MSDETAVIGSDGELLLEWLELLGWQIDTGRDGGFFVGNGIYRNRDALLRIAARARSRGELSWQLFEAGCTTLAQHWREVEAAPPGASASMRP